MSRRTLLALVLAAAVSALALARWWPTRAHDRADSFHELVESDAPAPAPGAHELSVPAPASEPHTASGSTLASTREPQQRALPRGPVRGLLIEAESRVPLAGARIVLLATPDNAVAETVRSRSDGSFTSTRAFPRGELRAWVKDASSGALLVRHEAEFDPEHGEWLVPVPARSAGESAPIDEHEIVLRGLVVDLDARAVEGALVKVLPLAGGRVGFAETGAAGEFELRDLGPGLHRVLVQGRFTSSAPLELALAAGPNDAGRILLPAASAGAIRGRLLAEGGGDDPAAVVLLRELESGKELAVPTEWSLFSGEDDGLTSFAIEGVPPGDYELELVPFDGRVYEPSRLRVSPPADGLEFRARGADPVGYLLAPRDARSGAALDSFVAFARVHGQWWGGDMSSSSEPFSSAFDRWVVYADGYRPARGEFAGGRAVRDDGGVERRELEIPLERGYGEVLLFKDAESDLLLVTDVDGLLAAGLADVQVLADGKPAGRSDADGLVVLDLARAPERLEFVRPGWRVAGELIEEDMHVVHMARE